MKGLIEFFRDRLGLELWPGQVGVLEEWAESGKPNALLCLGRRSGKNTMMAGAAIYNASRDYSAYKLPRGWPRYIVCVANSLGQATEFITQVRVLLSNAVDADLLALVDADACTRTKIVFRHNVVIEALACSERSTRGRAVSMVIFDEAGQFNTAEEGSAAGKEIYRALAPSIAQFGQEGHLVFISTPKWRSGLFWDQYRNGTELDEAGQPIDPSLFVIQRATWEMNPGLPREHPEIVKAYRVDPDGGATEYGADFAAAGGAFLDPVDVFACRRAGGVLPPDPNHIEYTCAIDPAFARDAFAVGIAHLEAKTKKVIVDGVWTWSRAGFERTLDEVAELVRRYGIRQVRTDQFSSQSVLEGLSKRRLACDVVAWDNAGKYEAFTRLKALLATRQIQLPNDDQLSHELVNLEAKATVTGLTRIAASSGNKDDRASVLAALADMIEGDFGPIVLSWRDYRASPLDDAIDTVALYGNGNPFEAWPMAID